MLPITEGDQNLSTGRGQWDASQSTNRTVEQDSRLYYHQILSTPCLDEIVRAEGPYIYTASGRALLDFHGNSVHQLGFAHPRVIHAINSQMRSVPYCTRRYTNHMATELAELLTSHAPGELKNNSRILLTPSGSAAVGIALKIARACTGKYKTIAFHDSFHGATLDSASLSGQELFHRGMGSLMPGVVHTQPPSTRNCTECMNDECIAACATSIENLIDQDDIAAVVAEPIRATTVHRIPTEYWKRVRSACDRNGTMLIFDEIPTGLGRSGKLWATEHTSVTPDLIVIGKGLGGGIFPQAAVIGREEFNDYGPTPVRELALGHYTHEKSPVGSAAAIATIKTVLEENLVTRSSSLGREWLTTYREKLTAMKAVREVRQIGLMLAIELVCPELTDRVMYECLNNGVSFKIGGATSIILFPPLNIDTKILFGATDVICEAIRDQSIQLNVSKAIASSNDP